MSRLDYHGNALGLEHFRKCKGDLLRQTFLYLEATSKHFCNSCELGEADNAAVGNVAYVHLGRGGQPKTQESCAISTKREMKDFAHMTYLAGERNQVVLAH
jgi:hypothetical protein